MFGKLGLIAFPGLTTRGLQQFKEALCEDPGEISFGHLQNLMGLLPLGQDVDDPGENYIKALTKKKDKAVEIFNKISKKPKEAMTDAVKWVVDWAL